MTLPSTITSLGGYSFQYIDTLVEVTINCNMIQKEQNVFQYCTNLVKVTFGSANTLISNYAFAFCSKLSDLTLSDNLTNIHANAFTSCTSLSTFYFPQHKTSGYIALPYVDMYAFQNCSLTTVYFSGTKDLYDQKQSVSAHQEFICTTYNTNSRLISALVFYSETEPTDSTNRYWHYDDDGNRVVWPKPTE